MKTIFVKKTISYGHRLNDHKGHCKNLHGHNGEIIFEISSEKLNELGMIADFGKVKKKLCKWLDDEWDHKFLLYELDPFKDNLEKIDGVVILKFNPTAENLAFHLLNVVAPIEFNNDHVTVHAVTFKETSDNYARISNQ